jgi:hypothetical protein
VPQPVEVTSVNSTVSTGEYRSPEAWNSLVQYAWMLLT